MIQPVSLSTCAVTLEAEWTMCRPLPCLFQAHRSPSLSQGEPKPSEMQGLAQWFLLFVFLVFSFFLFLFLPQRRALGSARNVLLLSS